ncbi:MAG TPA: two-component system activity regulator YycH [Sporosarcina psychrophila]|uniref:Two-component system activity regulator YycH n=1 Tax=Sporosarcina psychrophila TaxID=1476 RepID=A0A921FZB9_SPOPS|nr:two-component system activity regulator YycH [Sporosarcina psychrophila]
MGLKYIETVKSIILLLLVALSMVLTFSIWTYTPSYDTIEKLPPADVAIAEKKKFNELIKPYKTVFNFDDVLRGTTDSDTIDEIMDEITEWEVSDLKPVNSNFSAENLRTLLRKQNRFTLFFHGEVPLTVYDNVLNINEPVPIVPVISFDRIIVDWNPAGIAMDIFFVSRANKTLYSAKAKPEDYRNFQRTVLTQARELAEYTEVNPEGSTLIVVPKNPVEIDRYTFIEGETPPSKFRDALFSDPNAVRSSQVATNKEELVDNHALMKIDKDKLKFEYAYPTARLSELAIPSELLADTINFVNEHGGWTDEFRYTYMNPKSRTVNFRLFVQGLPVYTDSSSTAEIIQKWGNKQIYKYERPYFLLNWSLPHEKVAEFLPSGIDIAERLIESDMVDFDTIDEIAPGYFMKHDTEKENFIMEPAWFYLVKRKNSESWHRFSPENLGGEPIGLE